MKKEKGKGNRWFIHERKGQRSMYRSAHRSRKSVRRAQLHSGHENIRAHRVHAGSDVDVLPKRGLMFTKPTRSYWYADCRKIERFLQGRIGQNWVDVAKALERRLPKGSFAGISSLVCVCGALFWEGECEKNRKDFYVNPETQTLEYLKRPNPYKKEKAKAEKVVQEKLRREKRRRAHRWTKHRGF